MLVMYSRTDKSGAALRLVNHACDLYVFAMLVKGTLKNVCCRWSGRMSIFLPTGSLYLLFFKLVFKRFSYPSPPKKRICLRPQLWSFIGQETKYFFGWPNYLTGRAPLSNSSCQLTRSANELLITTGELIRPAPPQAA